jgi:Permuted papain-like amidase enzyme, YaeF/YiiX, C92 family
MGASNSTKTLSGCALLLTVIVAVIAFAGEAKQDVAAFGPPPASTLESGDLLWVKQPGAIVPYGASTSKTSDEIVWRTERDRYIQAVRAQNVLSDYDRQRYDLLKNMTYKGFLSTYAYDEKPEAAVAFGGKVGVGHVAIVRCDGTSVSIVEALWGQGVRETSYEMWARERQGQLVWHGRLSNVSAATRVNVAEVAHGFVGKPYWFWNFDLANTDGFYCSKLAWLSIRTASGIIADDNPNPLRALWFSPKQLLHSHHLTILQNPGSYATQ